MTQPENHNSKPSRALATLSRSGASELRRFQFKLTFVGAQRKPVPTLVFATFHHLVRMEWFLALRSPGLHYGNDDAALLTFVVSPTEMQKIVARLAERGEALDRREAVAPVISLMAATGEDRLRATGFEAVLDQDIALAVSEAIRGGLDASNGVGLTVMDLQRAVVFPAAGDMAR